MMKGFKETHSRMACGSEMYEKIGTDRWFILWWLFYQCFRRKLIICHQSVCWLLSNNPWICAPVSSSFEGCQISPRGKRDNPAFLFGGLWKGQCAFINWTTFALCIFLGWQQNNAVGTQGKLKGALDFVVRKIGVLGTDEEMEDFEGSVSERRSQKVGCREGIEDKATVKHLCYLIVHGTT